ncbi:CsbD family protein [Corynebacterium sputi]|uniref:CsbD family protein n=1 Tax=Corynebacterium sputi TaxID=489915 RepID=UPI000405858A|nr:CsbD family protein [Corynebacterium sputi]
MGLDDKMKNAAEKAGGEAKETFGEATDNEQLQAEGKADKLKSDAKEKFEDVKDKAAEKFNNLTDRD